jgi:o-succinylbenzoate synthase
MAKIEFKEYELPFKMTYRYAKGNYQQRRGLLIRIDIDDHTGWGEASPALYVPVDIPKYTRHAEELVKGIDIADDTFLQRLDERNPESSLRCGISTAYLSAHAAANNMSFSRYLCSKEREPVEYVPVNGLVVKDTVEGAVAQARGYTETGMKTIKIKCFTDFERDVARVAAIRRAFPSATLRLDPNEAWTEDSALSYLEQMSRFDIQYVEDALPPDRSLETFADLKAKSPIKLAWDEPACSLEAVKDLVAAEAADVLILKLQRIGGPDRLYNIIRFSEQHGVRSVVTMSMETAIGTVAALHCASLLPEPIPACGIGLSHFFERDIAAAPHIENGYMRVPTRPGLGLDDVSF